MRHVANVVGFITTTTCTTSTIMMKKNMMPNRVVITTMVSLWSMTMSSLAPCEKILNFALLNR